MKKRLKSHDLLKYFTFLPIFLIVFRISKIQRMRQAVIRPSHSLLIYKNLTTSVSIRKQRSDRPS